MEDGSDNHLHVRGMVPEHRDGPTFTIIPTIGGGILIPKCTDTIVDTITLGPHVCFAPSNCFAYDSPNLMYSQVRGWGL